VNSHHHPKPRAWLCVVLLGTLMAGCTVTPTAHEKSFGESVRQAQTLQSAQPPGSSAERGDIVTNGIAAAHGIDRYHQSFARPPTPSTPLTVLNIQTGSGAQAMPR
jgi:hypothetical protein